MSLTPLIITCEGLISSVWQTVWPNAIVRTFGTHKPLDDIDIVFVLAGEPDWLTLVAFYTHRAMPVVVLSRHQQLSELQQAFSAGATGYVDVLSSAHELTLASQAIMQGALWVPPALLNRLMSVIAEQPPIKEHRSDSDPFCVLSTREREVAEAVCQGHSNKHVAQQLAIAERTVKLHLTSVFNKLDIKDRMQLLLLSRQ